MKIRIKKRAQITLRSMFITLLILSCAFATVVFMGKVYTVTENTAFGKNASAFYFAEKDTVSLFGKELYFPFIPLCEKAWEGIKHYSSGIVKLFSFALSCVAELFTNLIDYIVSSLK